MKRTVSSDRPFGALSDSMTVSNPYLYWSTSITADLIDGLLYGRHVSLRSRFQGPRVGLSVMVVGPYPIVFDLFQEPLRPRRFVPPYLMIWQAFSKRRERFQYRPWSLSQPRLNRIAPAASAGFDPHGGQHMRGLRPCRTNRPRRTRPRRPRDRSAITAVSAFSAGNGEQGGIGQPLGFRRRK